MVDKKKSVKNGNYTSQLQLVAKRQVARVPRGRRSLATQASGDILRQRAVHKIELGLQNEELKLAKMALVEAKDKYQELYDFAPVGYFTLTRAGFIVEANLFGAAMLGLNRSKLVRQSLTQFVAMQDLTRWKGHLADVLRSKDRQTCELMLKRCDGSSFHVRLDSIRLDRPVPKAGDGVVSVIHSVIHVAASDITECKRAEKSLQKSEVLYRTLVENVSFGIALIGRDHRISMVNVAQAQMFHKMPDVFIGKHCFAEFEKRNHVCSHCPGTLAMASGKPAEVRTKGIRDDGSGFCVRIQAFPLFSADGQAEGFIEVAEDTTEQTRLEEQLRQTQKMEAVGKLAGGVAHDFRNQLTVIQGYGEMLLRHNMVSGKAEDYVHGILTATERSATTASRLLAFARRETLQPQIVNIGDEIAGLVEVLSGIIGEDIHLAIVRRNSSCYANIDPGQLQQALLNLVLNAREAMPGGGELTLETDCVDLDARTVKKHPDARPGRYSMVSVKDGGSGIPPNVLEHVFEPFYTTKEVGRGTGLGLAMVQGFVYQSGGFVEVDSTIGEGSTFRLYFPYIGVVPKPVSINGDLKTAIGGTETILVVEDEAPLRALLVQQLEELRYNVLQAANPQEAMAQLDNHPGRIDLLMTDIVMPGCSGIELTDRIKAIRTEIQVLFLSGYGSGELTRRGVAETKANFLAKPFSCEQLAESIRSALAAAKK